MADSIVSSSKITAIANAIRTKAGTQNTMTLDEMPTAIANIPGGGGGAIDLTGYNGKNWSAATAPHVDTSGMTDMDNMFYGNLASSIDVSNFNTSNVTRMISMFQGCNNVTSLNLSNWNTSKVLTMSSMFYECNALTTINLSSSFNTSNVTSMRNMFYRCYQLTSLDVSNFNTSKVDDMNSIFASCRALTSLDVSNWDTSKVVYFSYMFSNCTHLTSLDVSNFNTSTATSMNSMFSYIAYSAQTPLSLDLSTFRTPRVTNMNSMFANANINVLDLDNWSTSSVTNMGSMFSSAFPSGGKMWVPSTFVANNIYGSSKPFYANPAGQVQVYTDATDATTQGWGTPAANFIFHYNSTHQDFLNA